LVHFGKRIKDTGSKMTKTFQMKSLISVLFTVLILAGCKDKKGEPAGKDLIVDPLVASGGSIAVDSALIRSVITSFYTWYNQYYEKLTGYRLYSSSKKKDSPPYTINWDEVKRYQLFIRDSISQLGQEFLKNQWRFFEQCDSAFKVDLEDDIPYGFDYDWYTNSQEEPQYLLDAINSRLSSWEIKLHDKDAYVTIKGFNEHAGKQERINFISLVMKNENGTWTIAQIGTAE